MHHSTANSYCSAPRRRTKTALRTVRRSQKSRSSAWNIRLLKGKMCLASAISSVFLCPIQLCCSKSYSKITAGRGRVKCTMYPFLALFFPLLGLIWMVFAHVCSLPCCRVEESIAGPWTLIYMCFIGMKPVSFFGIHKLSTGNQHISSLVRDLGLLLGKLY